MASGRGVLLFWLLILAFREMVMLSLVCYHLFRVLNAARLLPGIGMEYFLLL